LIVNDSTALILLCLACALGGSITAGQIAMDLRSRGLDANPLFMRWMIFRYLAQYKRVTLKETGQVGPLYARCTTLFALAGVLGIAGVLRLAR
jgi:hypothetical protein